MKLPRYFIGKYQDFLDIQAGTVLLASEFHFLCVDATPVPASWCVNIMRDPDATPHPAWVEFTHILDQTPLSQHFTAAQIAAATTQLAKVGITLTSTDTAFSLVVKAHTVMPCFKP
ncbi:MAG: hypothetical protein WBR29_10785 [Gammaproteobacteria bacterium]